MRLASSWGCMSSVCSAVHFQPSLSTFRVLPLRSLRPLTGIRWQRRGKLTGPLKFATVYSFVGSVFGLVMLFLLGKPISILAIKFQPMDYFLLAAFGLSAVGSLTGESFTKGMVSVLAGLFLSMIGLDSVLGTPRLTMGIWNLQSGIPIVPALVGLFGFSEVLTVISGGDVHAQISKVEKATVKFRELSRHFSPLTVLQHDRDTGRSTSRCGRTGCLVPRLLGSEAYREEPGDPLRGRG